MNIEIRDISAEVFGKYQYCSQHTDGLFYADSDFRLGGGLRKGALPSPSQSTPELSAKAREMHVASANRLADTILKKDSPVNRYLTKGRLFAIGIAIVLVLALVKGLAG